jgi:hypothetical protein
MLEIKYSLPQDLFLDWNGLEGLVLIAETKMKIPPSSSLFVVWSRQICRPGETVYKDKKRPFLHPSVFLTSMVGTGNFKDVGVDSITEDLSETGCSLVDWM